MTGWLQRDALLGTSADEDGRPTNPLRVAKADAADRRPHLRAVGSAWKED